ncbi:MAG TPA: hypothetical protein VEK38_04010, partial [Candidatus Bathyarchaeia archaeon]|nr:hypothetical protein [Candidatus Bathyarchaeia archaeon]
MISSPSWATIALVIISSCTKHQVSALCSSCFARCFVFGSRFFLHSSGIRIVFLFFMGILSTSALFFLYTIFFTLITILPDLCLQLLIGLSLVHAGRMTKKYAQRYIMRTYTRPLITIARIKKNIELLNAATQIEELLSLIHHFFHDTFSLHPRFVSFYIRPSYLPAGAHVDAYTHKSIEQFLLGHDPRICEYIHAERILIKERPGQHSIDTHNRALLTAFLQQHTLAAFIPIYTVGKLIAYITVSAHAHAPLYPDTILDMILYAHYLGTILPPLMEQKPAPKHMPFLHRHMHEKKRAYALYQESMHNMIIKHPSSPGIVTYKQSTFTLYNKQAQDLLPINIVHYKHHPFTQRLISLAVTISKKHPHTHSFFDPVYTVSITGEYFPQTRMTLFTLTKQCTNHVIAKTTKLGNALDALLPVNTTYLASYKMHLIHELSTAPALFFSMHPLDADALFSLLQHTYPDTP